MFTHFENPDHVHIYSFCSGFQALEFFKHSIRHLLLQKEQSILDAISISLCIKRVSKITIGEKTEICEGVSTDVIPPERWLLHSCQQWAPFLSLSSFFHCLDTCQQAQFVLHLKKGEME